MNISFVLLSVVGVLALGSSDSHSRTIAQEVVQPAVWPAVAHTHHSESPGKPAAAIRLHSEPVHNLSLYENKKLEVVLQNHSMEGTVDIEARVGEGLLLHSSKHWSVAAGKSFITLPVELEAQRDGVHHLHLLIQHRDADGLSTPRALAVQFNVGEIADVQLFNKQGATQPMVIQLHAEEEIF